MSDLNRPMTTAQWGMLGILSLLWGSSFFWAELALVSLPPLTLVQGRLIFGSLFLLIAVRVIGVKLPTEWKLWRSLFILGAFNSAIPFTLLFWGQTRIDSSLAAILNASTPVWSVLMAHFFSSDETITPGASGRRAGRAGGRRRHHRPVGAGRGRRDAAGRTGLRRRVDVLCRNDDLRAHAQRQDRPDGDGDRATRRAAPCCCCPSP